MENFSSWQWLTLLQHELLLFACVFFLIGAVDELLVDLAWLWLRLTGRANTPCLSRDDRRDAALQGPAAVLIPAWREHRVIGATVSHALRVWPYPDMRIYVGCYRNDPQTKDAVIAACGHDERVRLIVNDRPGPTTKADCLNGLYDALCIDEGREGRNYRMVVLHDAEDMVDPAGLYLLDQAITDADLAQLPVLPVPQANSRWIAGHYCEEFAEAHGKGMVVRDALRTGMPLAGVGCAIARPLLTRLAHANQTGQPFAAECLTEDYELGVGAAQLGGTARFIRRRHADGSLVATRACFPATLDASVRQKTRWIHGIAFQGWDHLGWAGNPAQLGAAEFWMRLRDRRGPFTALVLAAAYTLLILSGVIWVMTLLGHGPAMAVSGIFKLVIALNFASLAWRAIWRFAFTAREYGVGEGLRAILRIPVANIITIMAGRRAFMAYLRSLSGQKVVWDKTDHDAHPALMAGRGVP